MTQDKITLDRLKTLAVFTEEKFQELHPDVKNGDCIDVGEYLELLFDLMIFAGVRIPPVRIGATVYAVCDLSLEDEEPPFIVEYTVKGLALVGDQWQACGNDGEWNALGSEYCFLSREDAERFIADLHPKA